jgi:elongation factor P
VAKLNGSEIRPGMVIEHLGSLWVAVKTMAVKPGKGPAYNQVELKNLIAGRKLNHRFGADERVEETHLERRNFQFLYRQGESLVFMDTDSYEQTAASSYKPARLENGLRLMVPPFVTAGEKVVVDTNEVAYIRRADS